MTSVLLFPLASCSLFTLLGTFSGCSSVRNALPDGSSAEQPSAQSVGDSSSTGSTPGSTKSNSELTEIKEMLNQVHGRLDRMENKIGTKPDVSNEGITPHASQSTGMLTKAPLGLTDPDKGYTQDPAIQEYRKALIYYNGKKWNESIFGFGSFLERFPDHPLAGSALFLIGESYFVQKQYVAALKEYDRVLTSYDRSSHVSHALARIIQTEELLNKKQDAQKHRQLLSSVFAQSPASTWIGSSSQASRESAAPQVHPAETQPVEPTSTDGQLDAPPALTAPVQIEETSE